MRSPLALWSRLNAMTWGEIPHRVREQWRRQIDRDPAIPSGEGWPDWPVEIGLTVPQFSSVWRAADAVLERPDPDWVRCPETGHEWGAAHAFDIDLFCGVDPRASWAEHRLREVQLLAVAGAAGHARAERKARERVLDWIAHNPPLHGLGWAAGIEVACRTLSLLVVGATVASEWTADEQQRLADAVAAHGWALRRYPSVGSSANNHAVAELGARILLGDDVGDAFVETFGAMVRSDGSGVEEAPAYLAGCVEWALLARVAGVTGLDEPIEAACRFLGGLVDGLGRSPAFGDDDGEAALGLDRERWLYDVAGMAASALGRRDLGPVGWMPGLRAALLGIVASPGHRPVASGEVGGGIARLVAGSAVAWLDRGALGMPRMAAHGHADALSVVLHLGGRPILVDSGTGTYLGDPGWRRHARGAAAHNTLAVDGADPLRQLSPFQWEPEPTGLWDRRWLGPSEAGGRWLGWPGLVHERRVRLDARSLEIADRVEGEGTRRLTFPLHFAPELSLEPDGEGHLVRFGAHRVARIESSGEGMSVSLQTGRVSLAYGQIVEAPVLVAEGEVGLPWTGGFRISF